MENDTSTKDAALNEQDEMLQNKQIIDSIMAAELGQLKNASTASSTMIRRRLRENGFLRRILPPKQISDSDLVRLPDTEKPVCVEDMEADQVGAKSMSFDDTPDRAPYRADRFTVVFNKISSPEFFKNIDELRTYKANVRQVTTDNALRDIQTQEDTVAANTWDEIVGPVGGVGAAGVQQNFEINGSITHDVYPFIKDYLEDRQLNNGIWLLPGGKFLTVRNSQLQMCAKITCYFLSGRRTARLPIRQIGEQDRS